MKNVTLLTIALLAGMVASYAQSSSKKEKSALSDCTAEARQECMERYAVREDSTLQKLLASLDESMAKIDSIRHVTYSAKNKGATRANGSVTMKEERLKSRKEAEKQIGANSSVKQIDRQVNELRRKISARLKEIVGTDGVCLKCLDLQ